MYFITYNEYYYGNEMNLATAMDFSSIDSMKPFMDKGVFFLYIHFLYWAITCSSSGSYGDIGAKTYNEKLF